MTIGKYLLFFSLLVNTGINLSPLKTWIADILKLGKSFFHNFALSTVMVTTLGILAYLLPDIDLIIDIAGGVFGIPMIFLLPAWIGIKKRLFKNIVGHSLLHTWFGFWLVFTFYTIYKIIYKKLTENKS